MESKKCIEVLQKITEDYKKIRRISRYEPPTEEIEALETVVKKLETELQNMERQANKVVHISVGSHRR